MHCDFCWQVAIWHLEVSLLFEMPTEDVTFDGDERRLSQVVGNLLDNAIKFTPCGGSVSLSGGQEGETVWMAVSDTGVGIPEDEHQKVLDKFYQVENKQRQPGLGLGLAICNKIVDAHRGKLEIEQPDCGGTRMVITLPRKAK